MRTFTDAAGREWPVLMTLDRVEAARDRTGVDLARVANDAEALAALTAAGPEALAALVSCFAADPAALAPAMGGPAVWSALEAVVGSAADLFQRTHTAAALSRDPGRRVELAARVADADARVEAAAAELARLMAEKAPHKAQSQNGG